MFVDTQISTYYERMYVCMHKYKCLHVANATRRCMLLGSYLLFLVKCATVVGEVHWLASCRWLLFG